MHLTEKSIDTFFVDNFMKCENNIVTVEKDYELSCDNHEEADTKIVHHVCKIDNDSPTNVLIKSSDTDVLIIMLGNMDHLECDNMIIFMEHGNNNKKTINKCIPIGN